MKKVNLGYFVKYNGQLNTIKGIEGGIATLSNGNKVDSIKLEPVEIGDSIDKYITLINEKIRYVTDSKRLEHAYNYYIDCNLLRGITIREVLRDNPQIQYLHQLQEWLKNNAEGFSLKSYDRNL